ncbi:type II secretion system protein [Paraburkholderia sediminicola]|uniref:type II secretion system protein n=1 Tax=Paraburkholderia sediminicola TaxID=458836 RepID=UPI0038BB3D7A
MSRGAFSARGGARILSASKRAARHRTRPRAARQRGLALLALLIALTLMSIALAGALDVWSLERRREQEKQLLFAGDQYRQAIVRYYRVGRVYPASVDDLLDDTRFPVPMHHLRQAYPDPVTGKTDWLFLRQGDRFYGVYSSSEALTIKRAGFPRRYVDFETEQTYGGWKFIYLAPGLRSTPTNAVTAAPGSPILTINPQHGVGRLPSRLTR